MFGQMYHGSQKRLKKNSKVNRIVLLHSEQQVQDPLMDVLAAQTSSLTNTLISLASSLCWSNVWGHVLVVYPLAVPLLSRKLLCLVVVTELCFDCSPVMNALMTGLFCNSIITVLIFVIVC